MSQIQQVLSAPQRAFKNLFSIQVGVEGGRLSNDFILAESISFGDGYSIDSDKLESINAVTFKSVKRPETISIVFRETFDYAVSTYFSSWYSTIYDFTKNAFIYHSDGPWRTVTVFPTAPSPSSLVGSGLISMRCIPQNIGLPEFSWGEGTPITLKVSFSIVDIMGGSLYPPTFNPS